MAGDWIKVEKASPNKPEVLKIARMLGVGRQHALGLLVEFWIWLDSNCVDGVVDGVVASDVDAMLSCPCFASLLVEVGWVNFDDKRACMMVVNFARHNGETSKNRALKSERQARWRANSVDARVDARATTREEKRREEESITTMSSSLEKPANIDVTPLPKTNQNSQRREQAREILGFLNAKTGRNYRMVDANLGPIMARLKEGATERDFRVVIARKVREWSGDEKMAPYLRPATLFNATKFAQYVGEVPPQPAPEALNGPPLS